MSELYSCTPRTIRKHIARCLDRGVVPFVQSPPGMGKSSIAKSIAKEANLQIIDHRLSTSEPTDMSGLARFNDKGYAYYSPFEGLFPLESTPLPDGKNGWLLIMDEFNSAKKDVQAASYKLILDREVGQYKLHPNVYIICLGNLATDRAIVNNLSTAMQSRLVHFVMEVSFTEWLEDVAIKESYDSRLVAFLSMYPKYLMDFRPDHQDKTFCCPRTWEFMNKLITDYDIVDEDAPLFAGTITSGVAVEFIQFNKSINGLVNVKDVVADPYSCKLPPNISCLWATTTHLLEHVNHKNFDPICTYVGRFDMSFRVLFFRSIIIRYPELKQHPAFIRSLSKVARYLYN